MQGHGSSSSSSSSSAEIMTGTAAVPVDVAWDEDWARLQMLPVGSIREVVARYSNNLTPPAPAPPPPPPPTTTASTSTSTGTAIGSTAAGGGHTTASTSTARGTAAGGTAAAAAATSSGIRATSRGYHSAVVVRIDARDCMLVWGGLHHRGRIGQLELLDLQSMQWRPGHADGMEPSARFGHSCVAITAGDYPSKTSRTTSLQQQVEVDRLVFAGGSNGSDLVRNGEELYDIHVLHIVRACAFTTTIGSSARGSDSSSSNNSSSKSFNDQLVWSMPRLSVLPPSLPLRDVIPGRCHSVASVGNQIIFFGGGAEHTNTVSVLTVPPFSVSSGTESQNASAVVEDILSTSLTLDPAIAGTTPRKNLQVQDCRLQYEKTLNNQEVASASTVPPSATVGGGGGGDDGGGAAASVDTRTTTAPSTFSPSSSSSSSSSSRGRYVLHMPVLASSRRNSKLRIPSNRSNGMPLKRCSATAVRIGQYFLLFGGFSVRHRELGDLWALDLAYGTSDEYLADVVARRAELELKAAKGEGSEEGEAEDEEDDDSEDGDEGGDGGGRMNRTQMRMMIQLAQMVSFGVVVIFLWRITLFLVISAVIIPRVHRYWQQWRR